MLKLEQAPDHQPHADLRIITLADPARQIFATHPDIVFRLYPCHGSAFQLPDGLRSTSPCAMGGHQRGVINTELPVRAVIVTVASPLLSKSSVRPTRDDNLTRYALYTTHIISGPQFLRNEPIRVA